VKCTLDEIPGIFITDKPLFSSERMLRKANIERVQLGVKKILVMSLVGLDAKTN
jgi:hypothetical protein